MSDDFKASFLPRLKSNLIYSTLEAKCTENDIEVLTLIHEAIDYSNQRAKIIVRNMGEYTLHDSDHLFNVLFISSKLLGENNIANLSIPELQLLILSIFFHDLGMAPDEREVIAWRKTWDSQPQFGSQEEFDSYSHFRQFWFSQQELQNKYYQSLNIGNQSNIDAIKSYAISDYIRKTHAHRVRTIIDKDWKDKIYYRNTDLSVELASICYSHNEPTKVLSEFDKKLVCGNGIYICLPIIGIILRLADILDFDGKRTPKVLFDYLFIKNPTSLNEWKKHRSIEAWEIAPNNISFSAKCTHPVIESSIHAFCDFIDHELSSCNNLLQEINNFNQAHGRELIIKIPYKINRDKIVTKTDIYNNPLYIYRNTKFELSKRQVIELLMGTKLYGNPEVALRELIQNSIDACLLRQSQEEKWGNLYIPKIDINFYVQDGEEILEVNDNGTGMDQYIIDNYYSKIGASFYKSSDFYQIKSEVNSQFNPTSRFGIGILSSFMIADTLNVETRRVLGSFDYSEPLCINIEGEDSIFFITKSNKKEPGTKTKLTIRKGQNPWAGMNDEAFISYVVNLVPKPPFKIIISKGQKTITIDENTFHKFDLQYLINNNYSWNNLDNIKIIEFPFDEHELKGKVKIGILEKDGKPTKIIDVNTKTVEFEGKTYPIQRTIKIDGTKLYQDSTNISVDGNGNLTSYNSHNYLLSSICKVSFHGIDVPHNLVSDSWQNKPNLAYLFLPFQILLVLDISGENDLDLNSARTEILKTDKWNHIYRNLSRIFCNGIKSNVSSEYWKELVEIYASLNCNQTFMEGLSKSWEGE